MIVLGPLPRTHAAEVAAELSRVYGATAAALPSQDRPRYALNETRGQYHSAAILRRLGGLAKGDALVLGVTDVDLFVPDAPFVLGDADRAARSGLVSIARLVHGPAGDVPPEQLRRRLLVEAVHEVGQLLGLADCADARCAMYVSHRPSDADRKGPGLCRVCRAALALPDPAAP